MSKKASPKPRTKLTPLTIYLLREGTSLKDAFTKSNKYEEHAVAESLPFKARLVSFKGSSNTPTWADYLARAESTNVANPQSSIAALKSVSPRAAIALEVSNRVFVVPFGTANMHLVNDARVESYFGLRVALNGIAEGSYKSLESKQVSEVVLDIKRQASRSTSKGTFSLEEDREQLRHVVGQGSADLFDSRQIIGKDALRAPFSGSVRELGNHCKRLLDIYGKQTYKSFGFGFIDNVTEVRESDLITELNQSLQHQIRASGAKDVVLTPPRVIDWDNVGGFKHKGQQQSSSELQLDDYLATLGSGTDSFDMETAKQHRIRVLGLDDQEIERWRVYDCLSGSVRLQNEIQHVFVLSEGRWYRVAESYAQELFDFVRRIPQDLVSLPEWDGGDEDSYNKLAATQGHVLFDKVLLKPSNSSPHSKIEPCDLYDVSGKLIHVKIYSRSSTLSHLFSQGLVSAELILNDPDFREAFHNELPPGKHLITPKRRPRAEDLTVVYVVLCNDDQGAWPECLPFFSLVNLRSFVKRLENLGLKVGVQRVLKGQQSPSLDSSLSLSRLKVNTSTERDLGAKRSLEDAS